MFGFSFGSYEIIFCIFFIIFCCLVVHWYSGNITFGGGSDNDEPKERHNRALFNGESAAGRSRWSSGGTRSYSWLGPTGGLDSANVADLLQRLHQADHQLTLTRRRIEAMHSEITALDEENHRLFKHNQQLRRHYRKAKKKLLKFEQLETSARVNKHKHDTLKTSTPSHSDILIEKNLVDKRSADLINNNTTD